MGALLGSKNPSHGLRTLYLQSTISIRLKVVELSLGSLGQ
jgi:hypothetical protein